MAILQTLRETLADARFWSAYFGRGWFEAGVPGGDGGSIALSPAAGYELAVGWGGDRPGLTLDFTFPGGSGPVEIGSERAGHDCGVILPWDELDGIARAVAVRDRDLEHPGVGTLLLLPFAPIRPGAEVDRIFPVVEAAFRSLGLFSEGEIDAFLERLDRRREAVTWASRDPRGWVLDLPDKIGDGIDHEGFATRDDDCGDGPDPAEFPHEAWARLLAAARRTCREAIRSDWLLGPAGRIVRIAAETGDFRDLPTLADKLVAAGCDRPEVIRALRNPAQAARAGVVLEVLGGLEPGSVIRRHFGPSRREPRPFFSVVIYVPISRTAHAADRKLGARLRGELRAALKAGDHVEIRHDILFPAVGGRREVEGLEQYILMYATTWVDPAAKLAAVQTVLDAAGPPPGTKVRSGVGPAVESEPFPGEVTPGG